MFSKVILANRIQKAGVMMMFKHMEISWVMTAASLNSFLSRTAANWRRAAMDVRKTPHSDS